jgi:hypothetical protein
MATPFSGSDDRYRRSGEVGSAGLSSDLYATAEVVVVGAGLHCDGSQPLETATIVPEADSDRDNDPAERAPLDQVSKCVCGIFKRERLGDDGLDPS